MKILRRVFAITLVLASVSGLLQISNVAYAATQTVVTDLTDEQAATVVKEAYKKFKMKSAVTLVDINNDDNEYHYYGFDSENQVGFYSETKYKGGQNTYGKLTPDDNNLTWLDINNKAKYTPALITGGPVYQYLPMNDADFNEEIRILDLTLKNKDADFPIADEYQYIGSTWVYGTEGARHLCYIAEVPDTDKSLYAEDVKYWPKRLYVGVEDGELYRIDEEYPYVTKQKLSRTDYITVFNYPKSIALPEKVKNNYVLSPAYDISNRNIFYGNEESYSEPGKVMMMVGYPLSSFKSKNVKIPATIKALGKTYKVEGVRKEAFYYTSITTLNLGTNIKDIGTDAFSFCWQLKKISFNSKLKYIGDFAFNMCSSLSYVRIPNSVTYVGNSAFARCTKLKTVLIGKSIKTIGKNAFRDCNNLKTIVVKNKKMRKYLKSAKGRKHVGISKKVVVK